MKYDFSKAFIDGRIIEDDSETIIFHTHPIGELVISSGEMVACDPFVFPETAPFTTKVPIGCYKVVLSVASFGSDQRVAYAKVQIRDNPTLRWEMALLPDQQKDSLTKDEIFGYPVDAGTGCFMDKTAADILIKNLHEDSYSDFLIAELEKNYTQTWDFANICLDKKTGLNLLAFKSGWGDGLYASYVGYDEQGNITSFVTDFAVCEDNEVCSDE